MTGKKWLIVMVVLGLASFGGALVLTRMFSQSPELAKTEEMIRREEVEKKAQAGADLLKLAPREVDLEKLISDLRRKKRGLAQRLRALDEREKQVKIAADQLKTASLELENMRVQLAAPLVRLKGLIQSLEDTHVRIEQEEGEKLQAIAKTLASVAAERSSRIIVAMCAAGRVSDAAKILSNIPVRQRAKLLDSVTDESVTTRLLDELRTIEQAQEAGV